MATGLSAYRQVLRDPAARAFSAAGFVARLPLSMSRSRHRAAGLADQRLVRPRRAGRGREHADRGRGGPAVGSGDRRVGQARVLVLAAMINSGSLALLVISVQLDWPLAVTLAAAFGVGVGFSSAGSCGPRPLDGAAARLAAAADRLRPGGGARRGRVHRRTGSGHLPGHRDPPRAGRVRVGGGRAGRGGAARGPAVNPAAGGRPGSGPRCRAAATGGVLGSVGLACLALGAVFGGMEVVVVAFARETGVLPYAGVFLTVWAFGSLLAGVVTGAVELAGRRSRSGSGSVAPPWRLPAPAAVRRHPLLVGAAAAGQRMAIAPTLIASVAVIESSVPRSRLTEALNWTTTGMALGLAAGAAAIGQLIDLYSARGGFAGVAAAGVLLVASSVLVRCRRPVLSPASPDSPAAAPARSTERKPRGDDLVQRQHAVPRPRGQCLARRVRGRRHAGDGGGVGAAGRVDGPGDVGPASPGPAVGDVVGPVRARRVRPGGRSPGPGRR